MQNITAFKCSFGAMPYYVVGGALELKPVKHLSLQLANEVVSSLRGWRSRGDAAKRVSPGA